MSHTIGIGESIVIPAREITEEMHDRRVTLGLVPKNDLENGALAKILRAYTRPRGQEAVEIEVSEDGSEVKVTALAKGFALVDVVDEISEPAGHDTEVYVVRKPQLSEAHAPASHEDDLVTITAHAPVEIVQHKAEGATEVKADL